MAKKNFSDKLTDAKLALLERRLKRMYGKASKDLTRIVSGYWDGYRDEKGVWHNGYIQRWEKEYEAYLQGEYTEKQWQDWQKAQIGRGKRWETMRDQMISRTTEANIVACAYINDETPGIYTLNHNYSLYQIEGQNKNTSFTLADENTVRRTMTGKNHVNFRVNSINPKRDYAWNKKRINNALTQGILQGEHPHTIAKRFHKVMGNNMTAAIRNARTSFTSAQNAGRMDSYEKASAMGIKLEKEWLAAIDARTRDSHIDANGQMQPWDKPFHLDNCDMMYPGDPKGDPAEVYNCRCTVVAVLPEYKGITKDEDNYQKWLEDKGAAKESNIAKDVFGIRSNNNKSDPHYYDYKGKSLQTVEDEIRKKKYEVGVIFDKQGKAISAQLGGEDEIVFTNYQLRKFKGNTVVHNHPLSTPPSPEDLYLLKDHEAKEFRTCGKYGTYILKYNDKVKNLPEFEEFDERYKNHIETLRDKYIDKIRAGLDNETALIQLGEEVWGKLYEEFGVIYKWVAK